MYLPIDRLSLSQNMKFAHRIPKYKLTKRDISQTFLYLSLSLFIHYQIIIIGASTSIATKGAESVTRLPLRFGEQHLSDTFHFLADNTRTRVREGALLVGSTRCVIFRGSLSIIVALCGSSSQDPLSRKWSITNSSVTKNHSLVISRQFLPHFLFLLYIRIYNVLK